MNENNRIIDPKYQQPLPEINRNSNRSINNSKKSLSQARSRSKRSLENYPSNRNIMHPPKFSINNESNK